MRESEGVYQFGTKRVGVRVDKDKINSKLFVVEKLISNYSPSWWRLLVY
jgi:hypothetical protein